MLFVAIRKSIERAIVDPFTPERPFISQHFFKWKRISCVRACAKEREENF